MAHNRSSVVGGLVLILLGIIFLINYLVPNAWPVLIIALGVAFLAAAFLLRNNGWATTGLINLTVGSILLYQTSSENWKSWFYLWPLLFAAVGLGMLIDYQRHQDHGRNSSHYWRVSVSFIVLGLAAVLLLWFYRSQLAWPSIIYGIGGMFMLTALFSGVGPLAIPGAILGTLGLMLAWQNATGEWESWTYTWALIPASVGLGLFLAFLRRRTPRTVGLLMLGWSLAVFALFGLIFARGGAFSRLWPAALILAGLVVLFQSILVSRKTERKTTNQNR